MAEGEENGREERKEKVIRMSGRGRRGRSAILGFGDGVTDNEFG